MSVKVRVYGAPINLADELEEDFVAIAKEGAGLSGNVLLKNVDEQLSRRKGPGPAPAGEPPAEQEGDLRASFTRIRPRVRGRVATSGVQSRHTGASRLEFGKTDRRGVRTFPHPFLGPAILASEAEITAIWERLL